MECKRNEKKKEKKEKIIKKKKQDPDKGTRMKKSPSSRIRTSDLRMTSFTLQSSALPTELSKERQTSQVFIFRIIVA